MNRYLARYPKLSTYFPQTVNTRYTSSFSDLVGLELRLLRQLTGVRPRSRDGVVEAALHRFGKTAFFRLSYGVDDLAPLPQQSFHRLFD